VSNSSTYTFTLTNNRNLVANFNSTNGAAQMISPVPQSTLASSSVTFSWSTGTNVVEYQLFVGSTAGASSYRGGTTGLNRSVTVNGLPTNGSTIYVRLWSHVGSSWIFNDYVYTAASNANTSYTIGTSSSPANGGTTSGGGTFAANTSHTVTATANTGFTFTNWTENGSVVSTSSSYTFTLTSNRTLVANFSSSTATSYTVTVSAMPTNGGTVGGGGTFSANTSRTVTATPKTGYSFANWTENGSVLSTSATYSFSLTSNRNLVANFNSTNGAAQMTSPTPGSTFASSTVTFSWSAGSATQYSLFVGSSLGAGDYYGGSPSSVRSTSVAGLPVDGRTVYVRLWSHIGSSWVFNDYTYRATGP
jgi:hypothetical protein